MRAIFTAGLLVGLLAGCTSDWSSDASTSKDSRAETTGNVQAIRTGPNAERLAGLADGGGLLRYASRQGLRKGAATWHPVALSEAHAFHAMAGGTMVVDAPDGQAIRLRFLRHVEHADGNWTWIGRSEDARVGDDAVVTFGDKAVFGRIPYPGHAPLELTTLAGRTWLVEDGQTLPASDNALADVLPMPDTSSKGAVAGRTPAGGATLPTTAGLIAQSSTPTTTVDVLLGYTTSFATRLGGQSQAVTRLSFMLDLANEALANSLVPGQFRLVGTLQVDYPDTTSNRSALFELTGVSCTSALGGQLPDGGVNCTQVGQPESLQPLIAAREQYGADLVSLVRTFQSPENGSCGIGWMIGGGQTTVSAANAAFGMSVVSDTSGNTFPDPEGGSCRNDQLAHELGHNLGLQHDRATAQGSDDTNSDGNLLDPEEFGRYPYAFGYSAGVDAGNFVDVMGIRHTGQTTSLVYSNPRVTCGSFPCGVADVADTARALASTIPVVATFRSPVQPLPANWLSGDYNGDGSADLLWRNRVSGSNGIWRSANSATFQGVASVNTQTWGVVGVGDFNGDGKSDLLWRNRTTGANGAWLSANAATPLAVRAIADTAWVVAGIGDFDGDGKSDILWRNRTTGANGIWKSANALTPQSVASVGNLAWTVAGVGDFDGDGKSDILWRNGATGANGIWRSGNSGTPMAVTTVSVAWSVVGVGDFDGDHHSDILWRNGSNGANGIWRSASSSQPLAVTTVSNYSWMVASIGDFNNDGRDDVLWRNVVTGANGIWRSASSATTQPVTAVEDLTWFVAG